MGADGQTDRPEKMVLKKKVRELTASIKAWTPWS